MTALKTLRHELGAALAESTGSVYSKLGAQQNPPFHQVAPGSPYIVRLDYCNDTVSFQVTFATKPGDPQAVMDALDDIVDQVRARFKTAILATAFRLVEVSTVIGVSVGDNEVPGVVVTVECERYVD